MIYDIGPLIRVQDVTTSGQPGAPSGLFQGQPAPAPAVSMVDAVIKLVQDTIMPETWKDNGGTIGSIREMNGALVITHTPEGHEQIAQLLDQLTEQRLRQVRVRLHWVYASPQALRELQDGKPVVPQEVEPHALEKLPKEAVHQQGDIVCFSGQTVTLQSGRAHAYVSELTPVVGAQAVGLEPAIQTFQDGLSATVSPTILIGGKYVLLSVNSTVSEWGEAPPVDVHGAARIATTQPGGAIVAQPAGVGQTLVQRPNTLSQSLRTTLRVPIGKLVAVGGMTLEPSKDQTDAPQLLLLVEVTTS
jgi:type II secretory pathway component GspD/PulD (secretin)